MTARILARVIPHLQSGTGVYSSHYTSISDIDNERETGQPCNYDGEHADVSDAIFYPTNRIVNIIMKTCKKSRPLQRLYI